MIEEKNIRACTLPYKRFKTNSNLAVHLKCKHLENPDLPLPNVLFRLTTGEKIISVVNSVVEKLLIDVVTNVDASSPSQEPVLITDTVVQKRLLQIVKAETK